MWAQVPTLIYKPQYSLCSHDRVFRNTSEPSRTPSEYTLHPSTSLRTKVHVILQVGGGISREQISNFIINSCLTFEALTLSLVRRVTTRFMCPLVAFMHTVNPHMSKMESTPNSRATSAHVSRLDRTLKDLQRKVKEHEEALKKVSRCQFCKGISWH